ncbi:hypothetical protein ASD81_09895 [Nocardioides sp. Root614]|nr:hypothetical protein ASD81_09895 [Nocardioides sp. Root614]KRA92838.1 hypothetical protein ASD84_10160 [Nocardioides sp. Root682]
MRPAVRLGATLAAVIVAVSGLAGCGKDDPGPGLSKPGDAAKGERVDVDAFVDLIEASFDQDASARVAFEVQGPTPLNGSGVVEYVDSGMNVDVKITDWQVKGGWIRLRTVGDTAYMSVPESRGLWVDIGAEDADLAGAVMQEADPRGQTDLLRDAITEVRFSGEDLVGDVPTRRYQVVAEPAVSATDASATDASATDASSGVDVTEFWFDESGRIVRRSNDIGTGGAQFTWVDWDAAVAIEPPPARQLITLEKLEQLRRQQGK